MSPKQPDIFSYSDYRSYLKDAVALSRKKNPNLGARYFAKRAGFRSPATLSMIIRGKRGLGAAAIDNVAKAFLLTGTRKNYFSGLVRLESTRKHSEKLELQEELLHLKSRKSESALSLKQYRVLTRWYIPAIYELVGAKKFRNDPEWISRQFCDTINVSEIKTAIQDLKDLDLLKEVEGKLVRTNHALNTSEDIKNLAMRRYHFEMIGKARLALDSAVNIRDISGVTVGIRKSDLNKIKEKIRDFRRDLNESLSLVSETDEVYQLNIQFFPLTKESE